MSNRVPLCPPKWCIKKIDKNFTINSKTGLITWKRTFRQMKKGDVVGSLNTKGYIRIRLYSAKNGMKYLAGHHVAWYLYYGEWPSSRLDHKDGVESNNSKKNLREATQKQNRYNSKASVKNKLGVKGVCCKTQKSRGKEYTYYYAYITVDGKNKTLGSFKNLEDAKKARLDAEQLYQSDFAYSNR